MKKFLDAMILILLMLAATVGSAIRYGMFPDNGATPLTLDQALYLGFGMFLVAMVGLFLFITAFKIYLRRL